MSPTINFTGAGSMAGATVKVPYWLYIGSIPYSLSAGGGRLAFDHPRLRAPPCQPVQRYWLRLLGSRSPMAQRRLNVANCIRNVNPRDAGDGGHSSQPYPQIPGVINPRRKPRCTKTGVEKIIDIPRELALHCLT
jgi:hypothetical protein